MSIIDPVDYEVFVLGAGFTRAFNAPTPVMANFLQNSLDLLAEPRYQAVAEFIDRCRMDSRTLNIETLLCLAHIEKLWQTSINALENALVAERIASLINEVIYKSFEFRELSNKRWTFQLTDDNPLKTLARYLTSNNLAHVISFNYDNLLENYLELECEAHRARE